MPQSEDKIVYERKDEPKWGFGGGVTEDGEYVIIAGVARHGAKESAVL